MTSVSTDRARVALNNVLSLRHDPVQNLVTILGAIGGSKISGVFPSVVDAWSKGENGVIHAKISIMEICWPALNKLEISEFLRGQR